MRAIVTKAMARMAQRVITQAPRAVFAVACAALAAVGMAAAEDPYRVCIDVAPDIRQLANDDLFESGPASDRLVALGAPALPALDAALQREPAAVRVGVVGVLREMAIADVVPLLVRSAADKDDEVRRAALIGLGTLEAAAGTPLVEAALRDPSPTVRRAAFVACGALCRSPAALDVLVTAATDGGDMAAYQTVTRIVREGDKERAAAGRRAIEAHAVPRAGDERAQPVDRLRAAALLAAAGDARAVPVIRALSLAPQSPPFRFYAILALAGVPTPDTVAALRDLAQDAALRPAACNALGALAAKQVAGAAAAQADCPVAPVPAQSRVWRAPDRLSMVGEQRGGPA